MPHVIRSFFSLVVPVLLIAVHFAIMLCFINRWDTVVTITLVPIWMWAVVAGGAGLAGWLFFKSRLSLLVMLIWLATAVVCSDETPALLRSVKSWFVPNAAAESEQELATDAKGSPSKVADTASSLSIVSLNCDWKNDPAGTARALVKQLTENSDGTDNRAEIDVVFLQESPDDRVLAEMSRALFGSDGSWLSRQDCAILARGKLDAIDLKIEYPESNHGTQLAARLELKPGTVIELVNVHLKRSIVRFDVWRTDTWKEHTALRRMNRNRLKGILKAMPENAVQRPRIIGGDFGTPYNDDIFRVLQREHKDAFRTVGTGWGNTYPAKCPLLRIDQIWAGDELTPIEAKAHASLNSDHRQVRVRFRIDSGDGILAMR